MYITTAFQKKPLNRQSLLIVVALQPIAVLIRRSSVSVAVLVVALDTIAIVSRFFQSLFSESRFDTNTMYYLLYYLTKSPFHDFATASETSSQLELNMTLLIYDTGRRRSPILVPMSHTSDCFPD